MPRRVLKFDFIHENFDLFFARKTYNLTQQQKDELPDAIIYKLYNRGGEFSVKSTYRLSFLEKLFVLMRSLNYRITVMIQDDKEGISVEDFFRLRERPRHSQPVSNEFQMTGDFVLASKELFDGFSRLNDFHTSPQYNYLIKEKNDPVPPTAIWKQQMNYIINFLVNYEANKKKVLLNVGLTLAELCTLLYLYDGTERRASSIYQDKYKYAHHAGKREIQKGFKTLQDSGFIEKIGRNKGCRLKITALGRDKISTIVKRYFVDF